MIEMKNALLVDLDLIAQLRLGGHLFDRLLEVLVDLRFDGLVLQQFRLEFSFNSFILCSPKKSSVPALVVASFLDGVGECSQGLALFAQIHSLLLVLLLLHLLFSEVGFVHPLDVLDALM
uniref:Uncharacterized protein n=1 Tax=Strombidium inclinatum TaxID=197538 RepID=A0A7S3IR18_9SPIT